MAAQLEGLVLWCDADVALQAKLLMQAGLEVRCLSDTAQLLETYKERFTEVVAVVSSVIGHRHEGEKRPSLAAQRLSLSGRQQPYAMGAYELFQEVRQFAHAHVEEQAAVPVFAVHAASAVPALAYAAGADVCVTGKREEVQNQLLAKLTGRQRGAQSVLWASPGPEPAQQNAARFEDSGFVLEAFSTPEALCARLKEDPSSVAAVFTSQFESGGRKERGEMSGFQCLAECRELTAGSPCRPLYAVVCNEGLSSRDCYAAGADIALTDDNAKGARYSGKSYWDLASKDLFRLLDNMVGQTRPEGDLASPFPEYWTHKHDNGDTDFANMYPVTDPPLLLALQQTLHNTQQEGGKSLHLSCAFRIEDYRLWRKYIAFREAVDNVSPVALFKGGPPLTTKMEGQGLPPLDKTRNEVWLYHGTDPDVAQTIIHTGLIEVAGTHAGDVFGPGTYLAEASTKADAHAGHGQGAMSSMYALLMCRATLGRVMRAEYYYTSTDTREKVDLMMAEAATVKNVNHRQAHSLLADPGTDREFICYQRDQIYPEFVLLYHRRD